MNIQLQQIIPSYFLKEDVRNSQLFGQDIHFPGGEFILIKAQSGKGKTSLFNFLYGLKCTYYGTISIDETDVQLFSQKQWVAIRQERMSVVFQDLRLFDTLTASENVLMKNKLTDYKTESEIKTYFEYLGISAIYDRPLNLLSQGQRQRVAFIRALCQPFETLLLDEPFSHLDVENIALLVTLIKQELATRKAGMLLSSLMDDYGLNCKQTYIL